LVCGAKTKELTALQNVPSVRTRPHSSATDALYILSPTDEEAKKPRKATLLRGEKPNNSAMSDVQQQRRTEKILVLYGSQTGNSEQAAKDLCAQIPTQISSTAIREAAAPALGNGGGSNTAPILQQPDDVVEVEAVHMQLDDFLELEQAAWTRLVIIVVSSYGVGGAPLGSYRFRELCDAWLSESNDSKTNNSNNSKKNRLLDGVYFAMCGLGDSKYTTYFENPTKLHDALTVMGAERVGPLGKADASGKGDAAQPRVIEDWINTIWPHLANVVAREPPPLFQARLDEMQQRTVALCQRINPDFVLRTEDGATTTTTTALTPMVVLISILVAVLAICAYSLYY
jgi:sulfite reductase alpha subunit-like flavoprotein